MLRTVRASLHQPTILCNDRSLSPAAVLTAHKDQPTLEKRFEQTKTVHEWDSLIVGAALLADLRHVV